MEDWNLNTEWQSEEEEKPKEEKIKNNSTRRKTEVLELSEKYLYRRAFSELSLINLDINIKNY